MRKLFSISILMFNLLAIGWLLLCNLASSFSPLRFSYLQLLTLTTPIALLVNCLFVVFWIFTNHKKRLLLSLIVLLISYPLIHAAFGWNFHLNKKIPSDYTLKILSWNVHGIGIYDKPQRSQTPKEILKLIQAEQADIVCMPEYSILRENENKPTTDLIKKQNGYTNFKLDIDNCLGVKIDLGNAIFSKYPIIQFHSDSLTPEVKMCSADIVLPNKKIFRLYLSHLQSFMLHDQDKTLIQAVEHEDQKIGRNKLFSFILKFIKAYKLRALQANYIRNKLNESPYPIIFIADCNDVPNSYTYTKIKGNLKDVFAEAGRGFGRTFNLFSPTLRIDFQLYDPQFFFPINCTSPLTPQLSDHNPVIAIYQYH